MINRPIALLTDFGTLDHYVGSLKGVILGINPKAVVFDITHEIRPQNIAEASFVLEAAWNCIPREAIVVAVVDPGVGSARQAIAIRWKNQFLIGPDNGIFTRVLQHVKSIEVRRIENDRFFRKPVSFTFHGRDIFSPVAAQLSLGNVFSRLGPRVKEIRLLKIEKPQKDLNGINGTIVYIDRFGNAFTNIRSDIVPSQIKKTMKVAVGSAKQRAFMRSCFSDGRARELIAVWNSNHNLELAVRNDSAEQLFRLKVGDLVHLVPAGKKR